MLCTAGARACILHSLPTSIGMQCCLETLAGSRVRCLRFALVIGACNCILFLGQRTYWISFTLCRSSYASPCHRGGGVFYAKIFEDLVLPSLPLSFHPCLFPFPLPFPHVRSMPPEIQIRGLAKRCKLPRWGLRRSANGNLILCILALKFDLRWHQIYFLANVL